jgi:hypothetical protein
VVDDIVHGRGGRHGSIIKEVEAMRAEKNDCSFIHQGRMSNKEAHRLTKHALGLDEGRHMWLLKPPVEVNILVNFLNK